jgi:hypothetical protein
LGNLVRVPGAALVGAGAIAPFHADALKSAGFELRHIAASPGSSRAKTLAKIKGFDQVWESSEDLISSGDWDCLVLATNTESTIELLSLASRRDQPCLVEKPVAFDVRSLEVFPEPNSNIRVAYNRRFYSSAQRAREFAREGACTFRMELPDTIGNETEIFAGLRAVRENSVHGLDLLAFVIGRYQLEAIERVKDGSRRSRIALVKSDEGHRGTIVLNWNCPANFSLVLDQAPRRLELRPFELASVYEGMEILEPTAEIPVRRYMPRKITETSSFPGPDGIKPGFLGQAQSLWRKVTEGEWEDGTATLSDARFAIETAVTLIGAE